MDIISMHIQHSSVLILISVVLPVMFLIFYILLIYIFSYWNCMYISTAFLTCQSLFSDF